MPGHYDGPPKPPASTRSGASNGAKKIDPFNSKSTESGRVNDDERYNPWGKGSKMNPTKSSQTTGP